MTIAVKWKDLIEKGALIATPKQHFPELAGVLQDYFDAGIDEGLILKELKRLPTILSKLSKHSHSWVTDISAFLPDLLINFEDMISEYRSRLQHCLNKINFGKVI